MTHQDIPLAEARELPFDLGWAMWDAAKQEQDTGFMALEPVEQDRASERASLRAEMVR